MKISLLTGGGEKHYQLGLVSGLLVNGIKVDVIGNDKMADSDIWKHENVKFFNLRGNQDHKDPLTEKFIRIIKYYYRLIKYSLTTDSKIFHIQWLNKFYFFDRTILMLFYKLLGKKIIFTAHNVNARKRDNNDNILNRLSLKIHYNLCDGIIVHTERMKNELMKEFNINQSKIYIIPHGLNSTAPLRGITQFEARNHLDIPQDSKCILFFGNINYYKGLDILCKSFSELLIKSRNYYLLIAGRDNDCPEYIRESISYIDTQDFQNNCLLRNEFIPDDDIEYYFSAADCIALPYRKIYQSGVIFLAYRFGLPIIATDVGNFKEDILQGKTGFICENNNVDALTETINDYFNSDLYINLENNRKLIRKLAKEKYSWDKIGIKTYNVYKNIN